MPLDSLTAHVPPHWSPYAIVAGVVIGFVFGALTTALYALRLKRLERYAGSRIPRVSIEEIQPTTITITEVPSRLPMAMRCMNTQDGRWRCDQMSGHPGPHTHHIDLEYWQEVRIA